MLISLISISPGAGEHPTAKPKAPEKFQPARPECPGDGDGLRFGIWSLGFGAFLLLLALTGCATGNVNPTAARPNTGYVDFYTDPPTTLSGEISRFDVSRQEFKKVISQVEPLEKRTLRLAFVPGHHRLRLTVYNKVTRGPALVEIDVKDGMITPVRVAITEVGSAQVKDKDILMGSKVKGRRGITVSYDESVVYQVSAEANASVPYQVKERMAYGR